MPIVIPRGWRQRVILPALLGLVEPAKRAGLVLGLVGYFGGFLLAIELALDRLIP